MVFSAFERMVAFRYLRARRKEGFVSVIAAFSFLGIMLGVATLIIVMAVMNGFRQELLSRVLGLNGHLGIYAYRGEFLKRYIAEPPCPLEKTEKLEQLRALWMGAKIAVVRTDDEGVGVDTPEDAVRVEKILVGRKN